MSESEKDQIRDKARGHVKKTFSDESFRQVFLEKCVEVVDMDLRSIEELGGMGEGEEEEID